MADVTITGLPNASALTGAERIPMDQAGTTVDAEASAIAALATKATVGLGSVDNTSDLSKPISTATQAALDTKAATAGTLAQFATTSSAQLAGVVSDETGTGALVFANSPTLVSPALGTPSSVNLTNATGLPLATGVTGILPVASGGTGTASPGLVAGSNVTISGSWPNQTINVTGGGGGGDAFVSQPLSQFAATTSAQLRGVISDETGTGLLYFQGGALGTPSSATLTNATGLPRTSITGFGTGIATALGIAAGSAGAPVLFNGAGGTPSSITLTSATGLPFDTGISGKPSTLAGYGITDAVGSSDSRLSDAREWSAPTVDQATAEAGTSTARVAYTPLRVFQAVAAWWEASAFKVKLDGIASGATANSSDATLFARANHTGTQAASTISGLAVSATTDATNASNISTGTLAAARLAASGVAAGSYGSSSAVPVLTVDGAGRITAASTAAVSGGGSSGAYAVGKLFTPFLGTTSNGLANNANTISLIPFDVKRSGRVDEIRVRVATALASSQFQLAVYALGTNGEPTGLPIFATGGMSGAVATEVIHTLATPGDLIAGVAYALAINVNTGTTLALAGLSASNTYPWTVCGPSTTTGATSTLTCFNYTIAQTYGTWPDLTGQSFAVVIGASRVPSALFEYGAFV